jgi:hypothetical protein
MAAPVNGHGKALSEARLHGLIGKVCHSTVS